MASLQYGSLGHYGPPLMRYTGQPQTDTLDAEKRRIRESWDSLNMTTPLFNRGAATIAEQCGWQIGSDRFLGDQRMSTPLVLTGKGILGNGSIAVVEEVKNPTNNYTSLVRKRIRISRRKQEMTKQLEAVRTEISNLRRLNHSHIIKIIGAYREDVPNLGHTYHLLMYPVGDSDLREFLDRTCEIIQNDSRSGNALEYCLWIRKWFICLASALAFLHENGIRHEDIKPQNIIHRDEHIFFTDLGCSRKFDALGSTSTESNWHGTHLFAAPEVFPDDNDHTGRVGTKTDVFSLGLVFVEMLTVLGGQDIETLHDTLGKEPAFTRMGRKRYHRVVHLLRSALPLGHNLSLYDNCIGPMLRAARQSRPSAEETLGRIRQYQPWRRTLACLCHPEASLPHQDSTNQSYQLPSDSSRDVGIARKEDQTPPQWLLDRARGEYYYWDPRDKCYVYQSGDRIYHGTG